MDVVILGAGHAGVQAADSLREEGVEGRIVLVERDLALPYQRPPLSKDGLAGGLEPLPLRGADWYADRDVELRLGEEALGIDVDARKVVTSAGTIAYDELVLATGAAARPFEGPGAGLRGVHALRTASDASALRDALETASRAVVIGAGYIGLEFAAVAAARGLDVTVVARSGRILRRSASAPVAARLASGLEELGARLALGSAPVELVADASGLAVAGVRLESGELLPADLVVVGIGIAEPGHLAAAAGFDEPSGVRVDAEFRTAAPGVRAIGDLAVFPSPLDGAMIRIESVQHAGDSARCVARSIAGRGAAYDATPWFWSVQGKLKLQTAGIVGEGRDLVVRGDPDAKFSVFAFEGSRLESVESIASPADHLAGRALVAAGGAGLTREQAADPGFDLRGFAKGLAAPET